MPPYTAAGTARGGTGESAAEISNEGQSICKPCVRFFSVGTAEMQKRWGARHTALGPCNALKKVLLLPTLPHTAPTPEEAELGQRLRTFCRGLCYSSRWSLCKVSGLTSWKPRVGECPNVSPFPSQSIPSEKTLGKSPGRPEVVCWRVIELLGATALSRGTDTGVVRQSFRAAVERETVTREAYLHSANLASHKLSPTKGACSLQLVLGFKPWHPRDLQCQSPVSGVTDTQDALAGWHCTSFWELSPNGARDPPSLPPGWTNTS